MAANKELVQLQQRRRVQEQAMRRQAVLAAIAQQQGGGSGRGVSIGPVARERVQRQQAASEEPSANPFADAWKADQQRLGNKGGDDDGSGLFGNSIVKGLLTPVMGAMNALDAPRRIVMSGINEAADALNGGDASWSDFGEQIKDESFGFGDVVGETGNKWLDRAIGFAGDVALDPMTYVTLGSSKFVGSAGRAALAGEAALKEMGEEVVQKVAKYGEHALTAAERETLGMGKAGLRFGTAGRNVRIPGTEGLSRGLGRSVAAARAPLTDTAIGRGARRLGGSRVGATRDFAERLATGKGPMSATDAANTLAGLAGQKAASNMLTGRMKRIVNKNARELSGRGDVTRAVQKGVRNDETDRVRKITESIWELQRKAGVDVGKLEDYAPHYNLPEFEEFLGRSPEAGELVWGAPGSLGGGSGRLNPRVFRPNSDVTIRGKKIHLDAADIDDIETKLHAAFPDELGGKRLIEDDPGVWMPRLLLDAASDVGERGFEKRLMAGGSLKRSDDPDVVNSVVDTAETKAANQDMATRFGQDVKTLKDKRSMMGREVNRRVAGAKQGWVDVAQAHVARAQELHDAAKADFDKFGRVADHFREEADRLATEGDQQLTQINEQIDALTNEAKRLRAEAQSQRGTMNRARAAGYRRRLSEVDLELAQLREQATLGAIAAQELDPIRKQFGRAAEKQTELAAQVGEGRYGKLREAAGETLPQQAERRFEGRVQEGLETRADQLERLAQAKEMAADPGSVARIASEEVGRPVRTGPELSRAKSALGGATPEGREAMVEEAVTRGVTKKGSHALTPSDRAAGRRLLRRDPVRINGEMLPGLDDPEVLSDAVTNLNRPEIVQEFYDTQLALREAKGRFGPANRADDATDEALRPMASAELNAKRQEIQGRIDQIDQALIKARRYREQGIEVQKAEAFIKANSAKRNELIREMDNLAVIHQPRAVSAMDDMNIAELEDKAARLADMMVRYAEAARKAKGGENPDAVATLASTKALETELEKVGARQKQRLAVERGMEQADIDKRVVSTERAPEAAQKRALYETPEDLEAEVNRRWDIEQKTRAEADERTLNETITKERRQTGEFQDEQAKPKRAKAAVDAAQAKVNEADQRIATLDERIAKAKQQKKSTKTLTAQRNAAEAAKQRAQEVLDARTADLGSARSQWQKYRRHTGGKPGEVQLPEQAARLDEDAFKAQARENLSKATTSEPRAATTGAPERIATDTDDYDFQHLLLKEKVARDEERLRIVRDGLKTNQGRQSAARSTRDKLMRADERVQRAETAVATARHEGAEAGELGDLEQVVLRRRQERDELAAFTDELEHAVQVSDDPERLRTVVRQIQDRIDMARQQARELRGTVRHGVVEEVGGKALSAGDRAGATEFRSVLQDLVRPARDAGKELKEYQRAVAAGEALPGAREGGISPEQMSDLITGGRVEDVAMGAAEKRGGRQMSTTNVEGQLRAKVRESQRDFAEQVSTLVGRPKNRPLSYGEAIAAVKKNGGADAERLFMSMTPEARARFMDHVRFQAVLDNRRVRDINERLTRLGAHTGRTEVTDMWQEVLTATPKGLIEGGTMKPRDLSQLTNPKALAEVEAEQAAITAARESIKGNVKQAQQELLPANLPEMQRSAFEKELADLASGNQAARTENSRRVGELGESQRALKGEVAAGRTARDQLRAIDPDAEMARRLEAEMAPHRAGIEATQEQMTNVDELSSALHETYAQVDQKVQSDLSATTAMYDAARGGQITSAVEINQTRGMVDQATANLQRVKATPITKVAARTGGKVTPAAMYKQAVNQADFALRSGAPDEVVQMLDSAARIAADMVPQDTKIATAEKMLKAARSNKFVEIMKDVIAPGYIQYTSKVAGEKYVMRSELKTALDNMNRIMFQEPGQLGKMIDKYTQFFKAYATATPGFHVRNAMSATFMNAADGVSFANMHAGGRIWTAWEKFGAKHPDDWMDVAKLPKRYRDVAHDVVEAVYASGAGGQFSAAEIGQRAFGESKGKLSKFINENKWMKGSQRGGEYVEGVVRAGMAVDSLLGKGVSSGNFSEAVARINRIHFNYSDVGEMDQALRRVIPFWTFLSRNVPLQLQQMLTQPRSYLHYQSFVRNMSEGMDQDDLPEYMRAGGAFRFTPGLAMMPQLGATQLTESLNQLTSPSKMLAQTNPLIKAPLQVVSNRNFFRGEDYGENEMARVSGELSAFGPLYDLLGLSKDIPGGGQAVHQKYADATRDVIPPLAVLNRLFSTSENREGLEGQSWANWAGLPIKQLTPEVLAREQRRRRGEREGESAQQKALQRALAGL